MARFVSGQKLGEYRLIKLLGEGTFAEVWLGEKTTDITTRFALKVPSLVDKHGRPNGVDMSKVKSEAISWAAASDPGHINVVPIIEAKELQLVDSQGQPITNPAVPFFTIVTEYCAGGSLSDWLKQHGGKAPLALAFSIIRGVADGLVHLHSRGLIHRDIKPANVMMLGNTPRIADFGLVRGVDQTVTVGADGRPVAAGSPAYMSPEALKGDRHEDVDVWALGILLYEVLQGSRPRTVTASGPIPPLDSAVPFNIHELLLMVFRDDRTQRIRSVVDFISGLDARTMAVGTALPSSINLAKARKLLRESDSAVVARAQEVLDELFSVFSVQEWQGNRDDAEMVLKDLKRLFHNPVVVSLHTAKTMLANAERAFDEGPPQKLEPSKTFDVTGYDWVRKVTAPIRDAMPSVQDYEDKMLAFPVSIHGPLLFIRIHQEFNTSPRAGSTWRLIRLLSHTDVGEWVLPILSTTLGTKGPGWWEYQEVISIARDLLPDRFDEWYHGIRGRSVREDIEAKEEKDEAMWRRARDDEERHG